METSLLKLMVRVITYKGTHRGTHQPSPFFNVFSLILNNNILVCVGYEIKSEQNVVELDTTCECFVGKLKLLSGCLN